MFSSLCSCSRILLPKTYEWPSGTEPRLTNNWNQTFCRTENFVPLVVPGLSSSSTTTSSSSSPPQDLSVSLEPANTRSKGEAEDCSKGVAGNCNGEGIPEWLENFTEYLEIAEVIVSAHISHDSDSERPTKVASRKHSIFTHFPKERNCEVCLWAKMTRAPCRRRTGEDVPRAEKFGDLITTNHKVLFEEGESRNNHRYAVVVQDLATKWIPSGPCGTKTSEETEEGLRLFLEPSEKPKVIYTDNSLEFGKSCEGLSWNHRTSTPHRSETNGIAERAVRRIKERNVCSTVAIWLGRKMVGWFYGMLSVALCEMLKISWQIGEHSMRDDSENHSKAQWFRSEQWSNNFRFLRNTSQGSTNWVRKSCQECFSDMHCRRGESGKEIFWLQTLRSWKLWASGIHARRLNAKEVITSKKKKGENFIFPIADGTVKLSGRDHEVRESTPRQYQLVGSEDLSEELHRNSDGSQAAETKGDTEARNDFTTNSKNPLWDGNPP